MQIVRTATTVNMKPAYNLFLHKEIYSEKAKGKFCTFYAYLGGIMARATKAIGHEEIIIDGIIRGGAD